MAGLFDSPLLRECAVGLDCSGLLENQCAPYCQLQLMCIDVVGRARCADHTKQVDAWPIFAASPIVFCPAFALHAKPHNHQLLFPTLGCPPYTL